MKVVFLSNYFNHNQLALSEELYKKTDGNYFFIETTLMPEERKKLGYKDLTKNHDFVIQGYKDYKYALKIINDADLVIIGSAPEKYIRKYKKRKRLVFRYSERIYKNKRENKKNVVRMPKYYIKYGRFKNIYLLCAGAFVARDYAKIFSFIGKTYKWGYFTETKEYDIHKLISKKPKQKINITWVGRLIDWKHPESIIYLANRLRNDNYNFEINIVGNGELFEDIKESINKSNLNDYINLIGSVPSDEVRSYMEKANIFLFTSDQNEGWGAVLNESMNSGCAVVAADQIGSVPYLIKDGENGLIFKQNDWEDLYNKCKLLIDNKEYREKLSINAYKTIVEEWNAKIAVERVINLAQSLLNNEDTKYTEGICSKA